MVFIWQLGSRRKSFFGLISRVGHAYLYALVSSIKFQVQIFIFFLTDFSSAPPAYEPAEPERVDYKPSKAL